MRIRLFAALAGSFVVAAALAACATPAAGDAAPGGGADAVAPAPRVDAGWLDGGATIGVVTYGGPMCTADVEDVGLEGGVVVVGLQRSAEAEEVDAHPEDDPVQHDRRDHLVRPDGGLEEPGDAGDQRARQRADHDREPHV